MHFILLQIIVSLILAILGMEVRGAANIDSCKEMLQSLLTGQPSSGACKSIWGKTETDVQKMLRLKMQLSALSTKNV